MRAQYLLGGEQPSMLTAQNAIRDIKNDSQPVPVTVERIINEVARTFNVSPEDIRSSKRTAQISKARQVAIYVVRGHHRPSDEGHRQRIRHKGPFNSGLR